MGWLSVRQAAIRKGVARSTIRRWAREGKVRMASPAGGGLIGVWARERKMSIVWWPDIENLRPRRHRVAR